MYMESNLRRNNSKIKSEGKAFAMKILPF